jgi:hypothetical protein
MEAIMVRCVADGSQVSTPFLRSGGYGRETDVKLEFDVDVAKALLTEVGFCRMALRLGWIVRMTVKYKTMKQICLAIASMWAGIMSPLIGQPRQSQTIFPEGRWALKPISTIGWRHTARHGWF